MSIVKIKALVDGPFRLSVDSEEESIKNILFNSSGKPITIKKNSILCRCGKSSKQPFCDGVHRINGYKSRDKSSNQQAGEDFEKCKITIVKNGPIEVEGDVPLHVEENYEEIDLKKYRLCRCGASKSEPFCDNEHLNLNLSRYTF